MRLSRTLACVFSLTIAMGAVLGTEEDAIKTVTVAGGKITYDKVNKKKSVGGVTLSGPKVTDAVMKDILEFTALSRIVIKNSPKVTADGVGQLSKVKLLQTVELAGPMLTDDAVKALATVKGITELTLSDGVMTDEGIKELAGLTKLQTLVLSKNKKVLGTSVPALAAVKSLKYLTISDCTIGDAAGWSGLKGNSNLATLSLPQAGVTDEGLKEIGKLTQLKSLSLNSSPITDAGLEELKGLRSLERLSLTGTKITEKAVPTLSQFKRLEFLTINEKQFGNAGVEALKKALPKCDVNAVP